MLERAAPPAVVEWPALVAGRLTIDGEAPDALSPDGVELTARTQDGSWVRTARLARDGRFTLADLPRTELELSFQPLSSTERQLLLPFVALAPRALQDGELKLDWKTTQVNVRVIDDGQPAVVARVEIEGPSYRTSITTNDKGTARLSLVGAGRFSFRAVQPNGRKGEAALELGADDELTSVVIAAETR